MPIYEFTCKSCEKNFEEVVLKESETISCPDCSSQDVVKLMSSCRHSSFGNIGALQQEASSRGCASCTSKNCSSCG